MNKKLIIPKRMERPILCLITILPLILITNAFAETSTVNVGANPMGIALNQVTNKIYVANYGSGIESPIGGGGNTVSVIDVDSKKVISTIKVGKSPAGIAVNEKTNRIYVTNIDSGTVSIIDGTSEKILDTINVGSRPQGIAVNEKTNMIYVAVHSSNSIAVINGVTHEIKSIGLTLNPIGVAVNPITNMIYVSAGFVVIINGTTNETIVLEGVRGDNQLSVDYSSNMVYAADYVSRSVSVLNGATNKTQAKNVDFYPHGIESIPGSNKVYVSDFGNGGGGNTVYLIDTKTGNQMEKISVGISPFHIVLNDKTSELYVSNTDSNTISILKIPDVISQTPLNQESIQTLENRIPDWVKNTMKWYIEGKISEDEMINALQFLIKQGIIKV